MPFIINTPIDIEDDAGKTQYLISQKHRGQPTDEISIWELSFEEEVDCFSTSHHKGWNSGPTGWGCHLNGAGTLQVLGRNLKNPQLRIAKFVSNQELWHGYPADIRNKPHDKPLPSILSAWFEEKVITKAIMSRIKQGQL